MPLVSVQQYKSLAVEPILTGGTQYVEGELSFAGSNELVLSEAVFPTTGWYVAFDYSAPGASFPGGQASLTANVSVDASALTYSEAGTLEDDPANSRVLLKLRSKATNGTQYVPASGPLTITDGAKIYLAPSLYASPNTYVLFDVPSGTLTATLSGNNLTGLTVIPQKAGLSVSGGYAFWDSVNKQVKVTLV